MKKHHIMLTIRLVGLISLINISCTTKKEAKPDFTFVFMTDIHLSPEKSAPVGFQQAIDTVNRLNPAFVITGGDLIMDALARAETGQTRFINYIVD